MNQKVLRLCILLSAAALTAQVDQLRAESAGQEEK